MQIDPALQQKLRAIAAGEITDPNQVRPILAEADGINEDLCESLADLQALIFRASRCFSYGPNDDFVTGIRSRGET